MKRYTELSKLDVVIKVDDKTFLASDMWVKKPRVHLAVNLFSFHIPEWNVNT